MQQSVVDFSSPLRETEEANHGTSKQDSNCSLAYLPTGLWMNLLLPMVLFCSAANWAQAELVVAKSSNEELRRRG